MIIKRKHELPCNGLIPQNNSVAISLLLLLLFFPSLLHSWEISNSNKPHETFTVMKWESIIIKPWIITYPEIKVQLLCNMK